MMNDFDKAEYGAFWHAMKGGDVFDVDASFARQNGKTIKQCQGNSPVGPGATGSSVKELQTLLGVVGHPVTVTGTFDDDTENALRAFQVKKKLTASGSADAATWKKLCTAAYGINPEALAGTVTGFLSAFGFGASAPVAPADTGSTSTSPPPPNLLLWVGLPVALVGVGTVIYFATRK